MAKQRRSAPRGSYLPTILMGVTVVGLLGFSTMAVAWALGYFDSEAADPIDRTGQLAFPATVRPMNAYERVTKDDLINPQTKQLNVIWLPEATAQVASRDMSDIVGRVLRRDKKAGMVLTEADFMEKGTRPGLVAGIPAGKFAMSIPASGIPGLEQLRGGDRFDLLISLPKRDSNDLLSNSEPAALFGGIKPPSLRVGQLSRQHGVKHLVTNGMLINLFSGSERSTKGTSGLTVKPSSSRSKSAPKKSVFAELAVDPEEIGPLTEAISLGTNMTCVLRSGQPGGDVDDQMSIEGLVPVITTAKNVNAFSALNDENLMDESTGRLHHYYFPAEKISDEWITDPAQLYGRVVARPLRRGALITESDLLPPGTRPGISAGLDPGMAGMSLSKSNVQGFENLSVGDRFSILTRVPGEVTASIPNNTWATLQGGEPDEEDKRIAEMVRTGIREVVRDAIYLAPSDGDAVIVGIPEMDVAKLAQLIRDNAEVFAVARSSQQGLDSAHMQPPSSVGEQQLTASPVPVAEASTPLVFALDASRLVIQNQPVGANEQDQLQAEKIAVPILIQEVPAFEELSIDDFVDPTTGRIQTLYFDREKVDDQWELDIRNLIDRVALRPLRSGRPIRSNDLAPPGSPAGPAIGLEPGMRAVTVNSRQLLGLDTVSPGVEFDVVSAQGIDISSLGDGIRQSLASSDAVQEARKLPVGKVPASKIVASDITLLADLGEALFIDEFVRTQEKEEQVSSKTADGDIISRTVTRTPIIDREEITVRRYVVAVPESSVGSLLGMLDLRNPLMVSLRGIRGEDEIAPFDSGERELPVRAVIREHISGSDVTSEVFLTDRPETVEMQTVDSGDAGAGEGGR